MLAMRALSTAFFGGMLTLPSMCNVYRADVSKLCDAEQLSQSSLKANRPQVFSWMERNVASSEAVILVRDLEGKDARGIALSLRDEARKAGLTACALADQADMQAKDDAYHTDLVNLCSGNAPTGGGAVARLDILAVDDAERMREMTTWTATNAKSPDTVALVAKIAAASRAQRGPLLRSEAGKVGVEQCLMAGTLDAPQPSTNPVDLHQLNPNFIVLKVDGTPKNQLALARALVARDVATTINTCYAQTLAKTPAFGGRTTFRLTLDPLSRIVKATQDGTTFKGPIVPCLTTAFVGVALAEPTLDGAKKSNPNNIADATKSSVTFQFMSTTTGEGWSATIDQAWFAKIVPKKR